MRNIINCITELGVKLANSQEIADFCMDKFQKLHSVQIGIDENNAIDINKIPALIIFENPIFEDTKNIVFSASIGVVVASEQIITLDNFSYYEGYMLCKELSLIVIDESKKLQLELYCSDLINTECSIQTESDYYYPQFVELLKITYEIEKSKNCE